MEYFEWDHNKDLANQTKHNVSFNDAKKAFCDPFRIITKDIVHSSKQEKRYFCFGKINEMILTVRFTYRKNKIRIIGAGYWREGRAKYEKENKIR